MRKSEYIDAFRSWLGTLSVPVKPTLKVNGNAFPAVVLAVDFGTPLEPFRLSSEQSSELSRRMKELTTNVTGRSPVRINNDHSNGVYWTSV